MNETHRNRNAASAGGWRRLDLPDDAVEALAYLQLRPNVASEQLVADVFPHLPQPEALAYLSHLFALVNETATAATGKPGAVIKGSTDTSSGSAFGLEEPQLYVRIMNATPYVEAR